MIYVLLAFQLPPTSTPIPTAVATAIFELPSLWEFAPDASNGWALLNPVNTAVQVILLVVIIIGGLWLLLRALQKMTDDEN